ncbi:MAG TPA: VOC family protein [Xanthobacteraceae bacterium]|nr:VOC family protein [Xanthobacteraceae bacterium]
MQVQPYLFFDGRCDEALEFYKNAVGAKVGMLMRFKDAPDQTGITPGSENKVMHAQFEIGDTVVMASDGHNSGQPKFDGFSLAVSANSEAEAERLFNALGEGGKVTQPLTKTFFSPKFGMLADKFGVHWMVLAAQ